MRINSLYAKILVSFILLLAVTVILILAFFKLAVINEAPHNAFSKLRKANMYILQEVLRSRLGKTLPRDAARSRPLKELIGTMGSLYRAKIWIEFPGQGGVAKSFEGPLPEPRSPRHRDRRGPFSGRRGGHFALRTDLSLYGKNDAVLHAVMEEPPHFVDEKVFVAGVIVIGLVIALLTVPVSRLITVPLKDLRRTSRSIAGGNLGERVRLRGSDELGELGSAFNDMADRVEGMIRGTRELTAHISHELRSPLTRMTVALELMADRMKGRKGGDGRLLSSVMTEIREMDRLIGLILQLSKLDMKGRGEHRESVDLAAETAALLDHYGTVIRRRGLEVVVNISPRALAVTGVPDDMRTAIQNILDNAFRYSPRRGRVTIIAGERGETAALAVSNAASLEPSEREKIFQPFYRAGSSGEQGYGLGLAITRKIAELHGGGVAAEIEGGTITVTMTIPLS